MPNNTDPVLLSDTVATRNWKFYLLEGILLVLLGLLVLSIPEVITITIGILLGWLLIIGGIIQIFIAFKHRSDGASFFTFLLTLVMPIIMIVAGILLLTYPLHGIATLTLIIAMLLFLEGIFIIYLAFLLRPIERWSWLLASGLLAIMLAMIVWAQWPLSGLTFIGIILGVNFLIWGISEISLSMSLRKLQK